ncbi:hypothetical protein BDY17DRAFT_325409 [Neohortaea acidophila]|uniref:DUF952 domain protein n=1 Tax=Neohortaea acidophila TaxID=245834 RepID=A0A6A6PQF0_9PEZI|nr:uncharacterized protein BDY17DRAFT_325409 [Neohortaea acidophila]KAF2481901.1 hypothetical protein BDY17DRAFT_325409 [Neohortaea acidophila]
MAPKYLYKILDSQPPSPLPEKFPTTPLDAQDGFIHLSTAQQTPITAKLFFSNHDRLWVLRLDREALDGRIEYSTDPKAGVENGCAHVHDSTKGLGRGNVVEVVEVRRESGEAWPEVKGMRGLTDS